MSEKRTGMVSFVLAALFLIGSGLIHYFNPESVSNAFLSGFMMAMAVVLAGAGISILKQ